MTGLWELALPAGFYKVTLEDGTEVDSPEISAYCYAGDSGFAVSPADGATRTWGSMGSTTVSVPSPWELALGEKSAREKAYFEINGEKLMWGQKLFIDEIVKWQPTFDDITVEEPTEATFFLPAGTYVLTLDGKTFLSPEIKAVYEVIPKPADLTVTGSLLPTSLNYIQAPFDAFTLAFSPASGTITSIEASDEMVDRNVAVQWDENEVRLNYGITIDESNPLHFTFTEPIDVTESTTNIKFIIAEGVYTLTFEDGHTQPSPAINVTTTLVPANYVNIDPENDVFDYLTFTPAPGHYDDGSVLHKIKIDLNIAPSVVSLMGILPAQYNYIKLQKQKDNAEWETVTSAISYSSVTHELYFAYSSDPLNLEDGTYRILFDFVNVIRLWDPISRQYCSNKDGDSLVYTIGDVKPEPSSAEWIPVTDVNMLDDAEVALVWYYDGNRVIKLAPEQEMKNAPVMTQEVEECVVMNNGTVGNVRSSQFTSTEIPAEDYTTTDASVKVITSITNMPEDAAIIRIKKTENGYTLYDTNAETPGYLCPQTNLDTNVQTINITDEDTFYNNITINASNGQATIKSKYRDDANILSATTLWSFSGNSQCVFNYIHQALDLGDLYLFVKKSPDMQMPLNATPENGSTVKGSDGNVDVEFTIGNFKSATINAGVTPTAKFNDEDVALTVGTEYPVQVTATVPANTDGKFVVTIPAGWLTVELDGTPTETPAYEYTLNFEQELSVADVTVGITPENGTTVNEISEIKLTFPDTVASVAVNEEVANNGGVTAISNGEQTSTPMFREVDSFVYRPEFITPGEFTFRLAEGFYILTMTDGTKALSPVIETTVTVEAAPVPVADVNYTTVPADGDAIVELTEFSVVFDGVSEVAFGNLEAGITLSYNDETMTYGNGFAEGAGAADPVTTMVLDEPLTFDTPTVVTVEFAEGFYMLTLDDETEAKSPAVKFSFKVDKNLSVASIFGDKESGDVYTTTGIRVLRNATAEQLKALAPGMYICNGRVILKK